ncbi:reverse transcriptase domain-containing protein [Tanacetum coccineum]
MIHGEVRASKPKTMQDAIEFVTKLMDKKISTPAERQAENKRKLDNTSKKNQNQSTARTDGKILAELTFAGHGEESLRAGSKPLCSKCNYQHDGPCDPKCHKCTIVGHLSRDCRISTNWHKYYNKQRGMGQSEGSAMNNLGEGLTSYGMDWLSMFHAIIAYAELSFIFNGEGKP